MASTEPKEGEAPDYLTVEEVAATMRVHAATVRRACERGEIEGVRRFGRQWRIPSSYLRAEVA